MNKKQLNTINSINYYSYQYNYQVDIHKYKGEYQIEVWSLDNKGTIGAYRGIFNLSRAGKVELDNVYPTDREDINYNMNMIERLVS